MTKITEQDLNDILWIDFSIQQIPTGDNALILIFKTQSEANKILDLIHNNSFALKLFVDKDKKFILTLEFTNSEYGIKFNTDKTEKDYEQLGLLKNNLVKYITAGTPTETLPDGQRVKWVSKRIMQLNNVILN